MTRLTCPVCDGAIRVGERRIPRFGKTIHQRCAADIIVHECGQVLHTNLQDTNWLTNAADAEPGFEVVTASGERYEIMDVRQYAHVEIPDGEWDPDDVAYSDSSVLIEVQCHDPLTAAELFERDDVAVGADEDTAAQLAAHARHRAHTSLDAHDINANPRLIVE